MADDPDPLRANNTLKVVLAILSLVFNASLILMVTIKGDPANSLHSSALAWAFTLGAGTLLALGVGAITQPVLDAFKKR